MALTTRDSVIAAQLSTFAARLDTILASMKDDIAAIKTQMIRDGSYCEKEKEDQKNTAGEESLKAGKSESGYNMEEIQYDDSGTDDDDMNDDGEVDDVNDENDGVKNEWVSLIEDEEDDEDAKLQTMFSSHPMHFAKQLSQSVSNDPVDYMDQPPAGLTIQGVLRPVFVEDSYVINKYVFDDRSTDDEDTNQIFEGQQDVPETEEDLQKDQISGNGTSYYKLEIVKIHLIFAHGNQTFLELEYFRRAQPDAIADSATNIVSCRKSAGEKSTIEWLIAWRNCRVFDLRTSQILGQDVLIQSQLLVKAVIKEKGILGKWVAKV